MLIAVIAGGAIGSFQIIDENCTGVELAPTATCTVQVRFQPASEGVKKATLGLFGENEGPTPIVLTGVGSAPDPPVIAPAGGVASQEPSAAAGPGMKNVKRRPKAQRRHKHHRQAVQGARLVLHARAGG